MAWATAPTGDANAGVFFQAAQEITITRPGTKPNPYNPAESIPDWENATMTSVYGFIAVGTWNDNTTSNEARLTGAATLTITSPNADVQHGDKITGPDGAVWRIEGHPRSNINPFTGWQPTTEANLTAWEA